MFQLLLFFLLHCDEWDRVVALPRHKFVRGATLLQLVRNISEILVTTTAVILVRNIAEILVMKI